MEKADKILLVVTATVLMAIIVMFVFQIDSSLFSVMSLSFLLGLPLLVGMWMVSLSPGKYSEKIAYRILMPWVPVLVFFLITLLFSLEGWACWIMILPVFLVAASIGGLISGHFKHKKRDNNRLMIPLALILPFLAAPVEHAIGPNAAMYTAHTEILIDAPAEAVWQNVTRVRAIDKAEDTGWLSQWLGVPRPVEAVLDYEGEGAVRKAIFTGGLVFTETVTDYRDEEFMAFSIKPNTGEIPSTTFDEHVLIGGEYFDVLKGTYQLERVDDRTTRLLLWSDFEMNTTFNVYSGLWGKWIMKDIQQNILRVIKTRAEQEAGA